MTDFKPGVQAWTEDQYHADLCPEPALSSSLARTMINETPLHAWVSSPRLNPDFEPEDNTAFDIGKAAHKLYLGKGSKLKIITAKAYNTNAAKADRDEAYKAGLIPLLRHQFDDVKDMVDAGRFQLQRHSIGDPFINAKPEDCEVCLAWEADGVLNRCMIDRIDHDNRIIYDFKTTGLTANPDRLDRIASDRGYEVQDAHYIDGVKSIFGGDWRFLFVFQEKKYPFLLSVIEMSPDWIDTGLRMVRRARQMWRWCLDSGVWPGYPSEVCMLSAPTWKDNQWYERELREANVQQSIKRDVLALSMKFQAPLNSEGAK